jgi:opacity protein-like surface antigen
VNEIIHIETDESETPYRIMNPKTILASALLLSAIPAAAGTTVPSLADPQTVTTTDSGWRVGTSIYAWTTRLDGDMTVHGTTVPVDVPFDKIFDNLKFTFMGLVEVGKGRWSFMSDLFYARLEPSVSTQRADFNSQIEQFIGNFAVFYNVMETSTTRFDTYAGARVNWMETDVDIKIKNGPTRSDSAEKTWVDPIIGVRVHHDLNDKFFIRALADIGGFGISSDITWQGMASLGYRITDKASAGLGYRGIGTDYTSGGTTYDVISHGLLLGFEYRF